MGNNQWTTSVAEKWGLFLPPARPSESEIHVLENELLKLKEQNPNLRVAILGSTIEYRDLCRRVGMHHKCIDYSRDNFLGLRESLEHKDSEENLVISDWLDMSGVEDKFDVFLGDLATTVTPVQDHKNMFSQIEKHCNPGAFVFLKTPLRENNDKMSHEEIFKLYRSERSDKNPFSGVWYEVLLSDYDFEKDTMYCKVSNAKLKESFEKGIITQYEYEEFKKRWDALGDFNMNIPLKEAFSENYSDFFLLEKIITGEDWYSKDIPIVKLRLK